MTIHFNPRTQEPYLRLSAPRSNIIITPYRLEQSRLEETYAVLIKWLNDPRVYPWLEGPPYPYLHVHAEEYVKAVSEETKHVLDAVRAEYPGTTASAANGLPGTKSQSQSQSQAQQFHGACPFLCIREVTHQDPETNDPLHDILIGNIGLSRYSFYEYQSGSQEREEATRQNNALPVGDERIVWGLGYFLAPSHHGQGIMTHVIKTLIHDWAVPRMNVRVLKGSAYVENKGSLRTLEKNDFEMECVLKDWAVVSESRGGGRRSIVVLKWRGL